MISSHTFHKFSFYVGCIFLSLSLSLAFFVHGSQFYTSFALGSWLVLDFVDYKMNKTSILAYFYSHKNRHAFYLLFLVSFIFCFVVDYLWGVTIFKMWIWKDYGFLQFIRMYLVMNLSFVLGMYELYRVVKTLFKSRIPDKNILHFRIPHEEKKGVYICILIVGLIFLSLPILMMVFNAYPLKEFIMLFIFISIIFISDAITHLTGGEAILIDLVRLDLLKISSLAVTILIAIVFTEGINLFGKEWAYLQMPFYNFQILTIPVAVMIGWIPLVIGAICIVNMIKHLDYTFRLK